MQNENYNFIIGKIILKNDGNTASMKWLRDIKTIVASHLTFFGDIYNKYLTLISKIA
jgi:hypothetical protein